MIRNFSIMDSYTGKLPRRRSVVPVVSAVLLVLTLFLQPISAQKKKTDTKPKTKAKAKSEPVEEKPVEIPFHHKPYRVLISVAFNDSPRLTNAYRRDVLQKIENAATRTIGQMWSLNVEENRFLLSGRSAALNRLTFATVVKQLGIKPFVPAVKKTAAKKTAAKSTAKKPTAVNKPAEPKPPEPDISYSFKDSPYDKVFLVTVEPAGVGYRVAAREWDEAFRQISPIVVQETLDRKHVAETAFEIIQKLFHPIIRIDRGQPGIAELSLRAGAFSSVDPNAEQIQKSTLIVPFYRYLNKEKVVQKIQFVSWTYLRVEEFHRGYIKSSVISGLRVPLGMGRRRVELMGMVIRPQVESTRLKMVFRFNPSKPLVGYRVTVAAKTFADDEPKTAPLDMITNRQGELLLKHDPESPMLWLDIHSGKAVLARQPFATGVTSTHTFEILDDSLRLSVEGKIEILKGNLINLVARRSTHMAFAKLYADKKEWKKMNEEIEKLKALDGAKKYQIDLTTICQTAYEEATRIRRRRAAGKIQKMNKLMSELIDRYLDTESILTLESELKDLEAAK